MHPSYGVGELGRGGVLDDEAGRTGLEGTAQVAGPAEGRHDQHPRVRGGLRRSSAVAVMPSMPGISTSSSATSGSVGEHGGQHLVAGPHLGDHLQVGLEAQQGGQRAADQGLVVGEQQPDHRHDLQGEAGGEVPGHDGRADGGRPLAQAGQTGPGSPASPGAGSVVHRPRHWSP